MIDNDYIENLATEIERSPTSRELDVTVAKTMGLDSLYTEYRTTNGQTIDVPWYARGMGEQHPTPSFTASVDASLGLLPVDEAGRHLEWTCQFLGDNQKALTVTIALQDGRLVASTVKSVNDKTAMARALTAASLRAAGQISGKR